MIAAGSQEFPRPAGIVRIISRLNIGGPAIQAITLTRRLEDYGYRTTLVRGGEEPDEGNMDDLATKVGVRPLLVPTLRRNPGWHDLPALVSLIRIIRREDPDIVHTHAAKGGSLGRTATLIAFPRRTRRPVLIHTYHGHSLSGYFSPRRTALYRGIERLLAHFTDRLVAVSDEVRDELVTMNVAPKSKFAVVPLGFDLSRFTVDGAVREQMREDLRAELGIPSHARVVTLVARLVPIKRVDRFLRVANALYDQPEIRFLIVGDGELRESLRESPEAIALGDRLTWAGFRRDMAAIYFASDVVVQTSDNEGTPVALIEAQAAGLPVVSTRVGGAASVVATTRLAPPNDIREFTELVRAIVLNPHAGVDASNVTWIRGHFDVPRLIVDLDRLYRRELTTAHQPSRRRKISRVRSSHSACP